MLIQYCSDLHLEFSDNKEYLRNHPIDPQGDILVLAGDIVPFAVMEKQKDFFTYISDHFETTYWLPGNHEYYHSDIRDRSGVLYEKIQSNVFLVNNFAVQKDSVKLIFSTLWTNIRTAYQWQIERSMNDFHVISNAGNRLSVPVVNKMHSDCLEFIKQEMESNTSIHTLVATHHVPTFLNYPEKYKGDVLNDAFAVELFDLIETIGPDYWIFGHLHSNVSEFKIGKTKLMTNQLGYVKYNEHSNFKTDKVIQI
jgi:predicted phosphohydrolase